MAAAQGKSLKAFIEHLLVAKAETLNIEVSTNPSPSGDEWFDNPENRTEIEKRAKAHRKGKTKVAVTLKSAEDIKKLYKRSVTFQLKGITTKNKD